MNQRTSPCTPPADPGSAAVVAHAAESSSGACIPPTLEQFQRWLENAAHAAHHAHGNPDDSVLGTATDLRLHRLSCELAIAECRVATKLLMAFKLEHSA